MTNVKFFLIIRNYIFIRLIRVIRSIRLILLHSSLRKVSRYISGKEGADSIQLNVEWGQKNKNKIPFVRVTPHQVGCGAGHEVQ